MASGPPRCWRRPNCSAQNSASGAPREHALNAVTNHYQCKDGRWLILSLLNEDRQWPTLARCLGREDLVTDPRFATKTDRHARSLELIKIFDEMFATKDLAEWRKILDGNGLVFGVVGILDDIPNDKQMIENEVLVPFENDTMLTINSPIWVDGSQEGSAAQAARHRRAQRRDLAQRRL